MKFRTGLIVGLAAGYVLGAKAGKERYEQIRRGANVVASIPPIRQLLDETRELTDQVNAVTRRKLADGLLEAGDAVRKVVDDKLADGHAADSYRPAR